MTVWRVDRFTEMCGEMDLVDFNYHGEDIALVEQIIHAGGSVVHVPSIIGQYLDYETQSVMRTPDNEIGRASWRERGGRGEGDGSGNDKEGGERDTRGELG